MSGGRDEAVETFVSVYRSTDPVEAEMATDALRNAGLFARRLGTDHAGLVGGAASIFDQRIEVPQSQSAAAQEQLEVLFQQVRGENDDNDESFSDKSISSSPRRSRLLAAGLACVFPGAGHAYARHTVTALFLTAAFLVGLRLYIHGQQLFQGVAMMGLTVIVDFIGAQFAVAAFNEGGRLSGGAQAARGIVNFGLIALIAFVFARSWGY